METLRPHLLSGLGTIAFLTTALAVCTFPAHAQLVTNGSFENDAHGDSNYFAGWTLSGNADFTSNTPNTFVFGNPHSGNLAAWLGAPTTDGFLSQAVATTPGQTYVISYWLAVDSADSVSGLTTPNDFSASFGGRSLFSQVNLAPTDSHTDPSNDYTLYSFTTVASSASSLLKFGFRDDPSEFRLDDISVTPAAVPEASTMLSLGLLLALGGLTAIARRKRSAKTAI